jgi:2-polyprenyl-3-methyl-5-hydroxy-6-metoxy-1,4-benzoquinol methylase
MPLPMTTLIASPGTRQYLKLRWSRTPYKEMSAILPKSGKILDLGCGHGLLSLALVRESPERQVFAVDHDAVRIELAKNAAPFAEKIQWIHGGFEFLEQSQEQWQAIAMIDVLHYFGPEDQMRWLRAAFQKLDSKTGVLIFREIDPKSRSIWSWINRVYEKISTFVGLTRATTKHFIRTPESWETLARQVGFTVESQPMTRIPFSDRIFVCRRTS